MLQVLQVLESQSVIEINKSNADVVSKVVEFHLSKVPRAYYVGRSIG